MQVITFLFKTLSQCCFYFVVIPKGVFFQVSPNLALSMCSNRSLKTSKMVLLLFYYSTEVSPKAVNWLREDWKLPKSTVWCWTHTKFLTHYDFLLASQNSPTHVPAKTGWLVSDLKCELQEAGRQMQDVLMEMSSCTSRCHWWQQGRHCPPIVTWPSTLGYVMDTVKHPSREWEKVLSVSAFCCKKVVKQ